jgi:kynureninase
VPLDRLITIEPPDLKKPYLSTELVVETIQKHASTTALILLPGIQYYSGQLLDIQAITKFAHEKGIIIGWDLAHAYGNVPLELHNWGVDFAAWCNYKYGNAGPGAIGGLFVHNKHGNIESVPLRSESINEISYRSRFSGWWGHDKSTRFQMGPKFVPIPGAAGWQLSNPSVADMTAVYASLQVFAQTDMTSLRKRSTELTGYLERLLNSNIEGKPYSIITPTHPDERGAQLSVLLEPGMLDTVMEVLEDEGVVVDERKPDVVRVAPAPLYNSFQDVLKFHRAFTKAVEKAQEARKSK